MTTFSNYHLRFVQVAVPSFKRSDVLMNNTYRLLLFLTTSFKMPQPILFLENEEEEEEYRKVVPKFFFKIVLTHTKGIGQKRNFMKNYFYEKRKGEKRDSYILYIDDDISRFEEKQDTKTVEAFLYNIIIDGFSACLNNKLKYWGINNLTNGLFMKNEISTKLKYIQGGFCGEIITKDVVDKCPQTSIDHYEDYDFNLQYYLRDKGVLRLNYYCLKTKPWRDGGINASLGGLTKRKETMENNGKFLIEKYGKDLIQLVERKWGQEPVLNWRHKFLENKILFAIPSCGRSDNILTLKNNLLNDVNADIIIVVPASETDKYRCSVEENKYVADIVPCEEKGIGATRTWILNTYNKKYDFIFMIDDDIEKFIRVKGVAEEKEVSDLHLADLVPEMINTLIKRDAYFGGITLCPNEFFAKDQISNNLKYISGALQIFRSSNQPIPQINIRHFEDYQNCIEYYLRDGIICRWCGVIPKTKNYNPEGGICETYGGLEERLKDAEVVSKYLVDKYGEKIVKKVFKKKSARGPACTNLRLNHRFKVSKNKISLNFD